MRGHYEAVADLASGFQLGDRIQIRRHHYTVVGLTRRMVSSGGDPMIFIPLKDAQAAQFLKDNDAIVRSRARTAANPAFAAPGVLDAVLASQTSNPYVNAVLVQIAPGRDPEEVAEPIRRWKRLTVYTRAQMEQILIGKLIATASKQIGMFLVILADEPTAPLDSERALAVIRILNQMARQYETAIIVVTHDEKIIPTFKRIYHIRDGRTHEETGAAMSVE